MKNSKLFLFVAILLISAVFIQIKAQGTEDVRSNRDSVISAAREIIGHVKYCALISIDSTGDASARTMNPFPPEDDMSVWMATDSRTRKYDEIKKNPNVTLYYANHASAEGYVTIKGKALLVDDMAEKMKRKRDYWEQAFPDFKYLILIKVVPERLEVVNYKHKMYGASVGWSAPFIEMKQP
jgi:general stress protein 26